jgi:ankyrin repeat protein
MDVVQLLADTATIDDLVCSTVTAAAHDNADIVKYLLARPLIASDANGSSQSLRNAALLRACGEGAGAVTTVQCLLDAGADVHHRTQDDAGQTLLHLAARWKKGPDSPTLLKVLLDRGADIEAGDTSQPPSWYPSERERAASSLRFRPMDTGETALLTAARTGNMVAFQFLLSAGADPLAVAADGRTCLYMAAESGVVEIAEQLLDLGLNTNQTCGESGCYSFTTPLAIALAEGHFDLTKLLLARGAVMESGRLLELATRPPKRDATNIEIALFLLPLVDFAAAHRAAAEASLEGGITRRLRELIVRAFEKLTRLNGSPLATSAALLQLVLQLCPESINDHLISHILEDAVLEEDYALLDAVLRALPEEMSVRISTDLSNELGPDPRSTKIALYLAQRYGGPDAWSGTQQRKELEISHWALPDNQFVSPYQKKDPVDMTSNTLWDSQIKIGEKLGVDVPDQALEPESP